MTKPQRFLLTLIAAAAPALAQAPLPQIELEKSLGNLEQTLAGLDKLQAGVNLQLESLGRNFSADYESGMRLLDERKYDDAVQRFDRVVASKSTRAEGAIYWKAYSLNRLGRRDDALAAIAQLRRDYPKSRWLDDAQALDVEVRQSSGKPVSPETESNEDLKLIAINALMNADPDRAVPLLEGILKGTAPPRIKDRALFVLAQSRSPRAQQVLADYAKGNANPDLQRKAMQYIGMVQTPDHLQLLTSIYAGATNPEVKRSVVQSLFIANAASKLVELARAEHDPQLKLFIVNELGNMHGNKDAADYMLELLK